jgi:hypothetical protein
MSKRLSDKTRFKRKRGTGDFETYIPWHLVQDFSGSGTKHKIPSILMDRDRHALSTIEMHLILFAEMACNVYDSKEQFPLDLLTTQAIAQQLNVKHPRQPGDKEDKVMSLDLLIIYKDGTRAAISVKTVSDLLDQRVIEKLEIERIWCCINGIRWSLFTDENVPLELKTNITRMYEHHFLDKEIKNSEQLVIGFIEKFQSHNWSNHNVDFVIRAIAKELKTPSNKVWKIFHHLCSKKRILFNYYKILSGETMFNELTFITHA